MIFAKKKLKSFMPKFFVSSWEKIKKSKINSIRNKLMITFAIVTVPIFILGSLSYSISEEAIEKKVTQSTAETMKQTGNYLNLLFSNLEDLSFQIFSNTDVQSFLDSPDEDIVKNKTIAQEYLNNISFNNKFISGISLLGHGQRTYSSGDYSFINFDLSSIKDNEIYKKVEANRAVHWLGSHGAIDQQNNQKNLKYSASAVRSISSMISGNLNGILFIDIKQQAIFDMLKQMDLGQQSEVHLISPDGRDISPALSDEDNVKANRSIFIDQEFFTKLINAEADHGYDFIPYNNTDYLMAYSKIGKTGYTLLSLIPKSILLADAKKIQEVTRIFVGIAGLFAIAIGWFMANGMGRTIQRIIRTANLAASGDMTVASVSKRKDELGVLTNRINIMISNTRELIEQASMISEKVAESSVTVSSTSQNVALVSNEIANAIQEISRGAMSQASDAEQGVQMITQLSNMINHVSLNTQEIGKLSGETKLLTGEGLLSVENLESKSRATTNNAQLIFADIQSLDDNSKSIGKIVQVMKGIADQINLLALNAAIEAARAGTAGRGFAVVADEVRKLAEQSLSASQEISSIVENTKLQTAKTVKRTSEVEETLKSQNEAVANTLTIFKRISAAMECLTERVEDISTGVSDMGQYKERTIISIANISAVSEETASSSEEVSASTEEQTSSIEELASYAKDLGAAAQSLSEALNRFKIK